MARFPPAEGAGPAIETLATLVSQRTEGNPLFIVNALNDLIARDLLVLRDDRWSASGHLDAAALGIPADVRRTIEQPDRSSGCGHAPIARSGEPDGQCLLGGGGRGWRRRVANRGGRDIRGVGQTTGLRA